jgi:4-amino-4-deoxy-L-arabinose transferase-like glycosyltransferase
MFGAIASAALLMVILLAIPSNLSIQQIVVWVLVPVIGFVAASQFVIDRESGSSTLYAIGLMALFLRLALGIYMYTQVLEGSGFGLVFVKDDRYFFDLGVRIAQSWRGLGVIPRIPRTTEIGPAYLNALIVYIFGPDPRNGVAVQSVLGALSVLLLFFVVRYFVSERKSLLVSFILAIYPLQIYLASSNRRDTLIVFFTLVIALRLLRVQSQWRFKKPIPFSSVWVLVIAIALLAFWRVYNALVVSFVIFIWFYLTGSRKRIRGSLLWMAVSVLGIGLLVTSGLISLERLDLGSMLFGAEQLGRFDQVEEAQTFGFLSGARGWRRIPYLIVTFPLTLIFGFNKFNPSHPDINLKSLGYLWIWTPLLFPMFLGFIEAIKRDWRRYYLPLAMSLGILIMSAIGYLGLIPRYRTAAEPFLIMFAAMGLSRMKRVLAPYIASVLTFCVLVNVLVWLPASRVSVVFGVGLAAIVTILFLLSDSFDWPIARIRERSSHVSQNT